LTAIKNSHYHILDILLENGLVPHSNIWGHAIQKNDIKTLNYLIEINWPWPVEEYCCLKFIDCVKFIYRPFLQKNLFFVKKSKILLFSSHIIKNHLSKGIEKITTHSNWGKRDWRKIT
jgi:hypothetical protein